jgi:hypothetical protein
MMAWTTTSRPDVTCDTPVTMSDNRYSAPVLPGPLFVRIALWIAICCLFPLSVTAATVSFNLEVLGRIPNAALPPGACVHLSEQVLVYLEKCERKESDPWLRDDIRIAWITTLYASRGNPQPHIDATYKVLGIHPDRVWPAICARRAALLGESCHPIAMTQSVHSETSATSTVQICSKMMKMTRPSAEIAARPSAKPDQTVAASNAIANAKFSDCQSENDLPHNKKQPMAANRDGNAPQKTCAYGAETDHLTGSSCRTETKREARRIRTSEFGRNDAPPAGVAAPADKQSEAA